jgi:hypothetical protein
MKRLALSLGALIYIQVSAQTIGIKTGLALSGYRATYSTADPTYIPPTNSLKTGFILGGYVDIKAHKKLFIRPGAELVVKGAAIQVNYITNGTLHAYKTSRNFAVIDFPINLIYKTNDGDKQRWIIGGGLVPGLILSRNYNRGDLGLNVVTGYEFPIGVTFNANFTYGLLNVTRSYYYADPVTLKNYYFGLTIGYFF